MGREELLVLGGGGHAKVVMSTARACGLEVIGILDDDEGKVGAAFFGASVLSSLADLHCYVGHQCVIAVGENVIRRKIYQRWQWRHLAWKSLVHPTAFVDESVSMGDGTVVFAGAIVQADATIGDHCIINTQVSIDHDCHIDDFVHLAPGCRLAGNVIVEEGAFFGIGSSVIPGVRIGANATVGAGAVVIRDVPPGATVVGVPARVLSGPRSLTEE